MKATNPKAERAMYFVIGAIVTAFITSCILICIYANNINPL